MEPNATKPNLVLVLPDQMRGQALGFLGEEPVRTPNLDRLAAQSFVLPQAVSNMPVCSPFRAMLMTGKYPQSNKVLGNCCTKYRRVDDDCELQESDRCWSDVLSDAGYSLGYIGKWHLDMPREPYIDCANNQSVCFDRDRKENRRVAWNEWCPPDRRHGFDFWYSYGTYDRHTEPMYWSTDAGREDFHYVQQWGPEHEADLAVEYLRNRGRKHRDTDRPFALVVAPNPPHMPYHLVPDRYRDHYEGIDVEALCSRPSIPAKGTRWGDYYREHILDYYAMVTGVDDQLGRILTALEEESPAQDTIVLFTSDHGDCLGIHNRQSKSTYYEESVRIPFLIRWPGRIEPRVDDLLISVPDIGPTVLDLMGLGDEIPSGVEGTSYASIMLSGGGERPSSQFYVYPHPTRKDYGDRGVRTHRYTMVINRTPDDPTEQVVLFDNENDPYQLTNIAGRRPDTVRQLVEEELTPWLTRTGDPMTVAADAPREATDVGFMGGLRCDEL